MKPTLIYHFSQSDAINITGGELNYPALYFGTLYLSYMNHISDATKMTVLRT